MNIDKVREKMKRNKIDIFLITSRPNLRYLTSEPESGLFGFTGEGIGLIAEDLQTIVTDFRYKEEISNEVRGWEISIRGKSPLEEITRIINKKRAARVAFEKGIPFAFYEKLRKGSKGAKFLPANNCVEKLRASKNESEKDSIRVAAGIADETFKFALTVIKEGESELDIAAQLEYFIKKEKGAEKAFDIIFLSGPRTSLPHGKPSERILREGDLALLDVGISWQGYSSDLTRVVSVGRINHEQEIACHAVIEAQKRALRKIRPGVTGGELHSSTARFLEKKGYVLGHGLGHGVGLEIHECPGLRKGSTDRIVEGMVMTVEPGIYLEGRFGIRIEDMVLVKRKGVEVITLSPGKRIEL